MIQLFSTTSTNDINTECLLVLAKFSVKVKHRTVVLGHMRVNPFEVSVTCNEMSIRLVAGDTDPLCMWKHYGFDNFQVHNTEDNNQLPLLCQK